ncbi:MAG: hypothetical protein AAB677_01080 [Patescibacteria group bacterium]
MFKIKFWRSPEIKTVFHPHRVWRWLMAAFLISVFGIFVGGYFLYRQLTNLELISQRRLRDELVEPTRLDLKTLSLINEQLNQKTARAAALKSKPSTIADPALKLK